MTAHRTAPGKTTVTFNAWPTYAYDNAHDSYNPNTALFTDANVSALHLGWQHSIGESGSQTQPILAANVGTHAGVLYVGGRNGIEDAIDALTGKLVWTKSFGTMQMQCAYNGPLNKLGIQATAVYDPTGNAVYIVDGTNAGPNLPQAITIYKLDPATGNTLGSVNITPVNLPGEIDFSHTGLTLNNGTLYVGTGSTCDISSWRGRLAAVNVSSMTLANTFFPVWSPTAQYSGGGVWGWGGAAVDASGNVYFGVGNADFNKYKIGPQPPFIKTTNEQVAYGEHAMQLSANLSTVLGSYAVPNSPGATDLDLSGSPVLFTPMGCPPVFAIQGKGGRLDLYNSAKFDNGPFQSLTLSEASGLDAFLGNGAYSPLTGLYYANAPTNQGGALYPPGMLAISVSGCNAAPVVWDAQFGSDSYNLGTHNGEPRSAPTVTAGGLVFVASPTAAGTSQVWVLDATTGAVQNGGQPVLTTPNMIRMPPVVDGLWVYILDEGGHLYGLTIDPTVPVKKAVAMPQVADPEPPW